MIVIGLTGSIGMGKSSVAAMFERLGVPSHDSDAAVHAMLAPRGAAFLPVSAAFPARHYPQIYKKRKGAGGTIQYFDRQALGKIVFSDESKRIELESILHPLVREDQARFIAAMKRRGCATVVLDIPLLFETDSHLFVDVTINVAAPFHIQRARVLARPNITEEKFHSILEKQMPSTEKSRRADYTIPTGLNRAETFAKVKAALKDIKSAAPVKYTQGATGRIY